MKKPLVRPQRSRGLWGSTPATSLRHGFLVLATGALVGIATSAGVGEVALVVAVAALAILLVSDDKFQAAFIVLLIATTLAASPLASGIPGLGAFRFAAMVSFAVIVWVAWAGMSARLNTRVLLIDSSLTQILVTGFGLFLVVAASTVAVSSYPYAALTQVATLGLLSLVIPGALIRRSEGKLDSDILLIHNFLTTSILVGIVVWPVLASGSGDSRFSGIYANPNGLGLVCSLVVPLSLYVWLRGRRVAAAVGSTASIISIVFAQSRTPAIALLIGLVLVLLAKPSFRRVAAATAMGGVVTALWLYWSTSEDLINSAVGRFVLRFTDSGSGSQLFSDRETIWANAVSAWVERPLLGYGYGTAPSAVDLTSVEAASVGFVRGIVANSYLQVLLETGVVGAIVATTILGAVLVGSLRLMTTSQLWPLGYFSIVGILIQFTESPLFGAGQSYPWVFWFVSAVVVAIAGANSFTGREDRQYEPGRSVSD